MLLLCVLQALRNRFWAYSINRDIKYNFMSLLEYCTPSIGVTSNGASTQLRINKEKKSEGENVYNC